MSTFSTETTGTMYTCMYLDSEDTDVVLGEMI